MQIRLVAPFGMNLSSVLARASIVVARRRVERGELPASRRPFHPSKERS